MKTNLILFLALSLFSVSGFAVEKRKPASSESLKLLTADCFLITTLGKDTVGPAVIHEMVREGTYKLVSVVKLDPHKAKGDQDIEIPADACLYYFVKQ